ncbi:RpiB/LacA/LacB family sugar-phosphate isomerase [Candidatus Babeliales bacterium]|nr:RpiB/LacA/LacB family sugar-phosphate isomerase [Candidatus Babeliales bacterium]
MKLAIGTDHRGFELKELLKQISQLSDVTLEWYDKGAHEPDPSDYPIYAKAVCDSILKRESDGGVLLCGSGIGMCIAANRLSGIYAGLVWEPSVAAASKERDNTNVIVLPADYISASRAQEILEAWITSRFAGGRHARRLQLLEQMR